MSFVLRCVMSFVLRVVCYELCVTVCYELLSISDLGTDLLTPVQRQEDYFHVSDLVVCVVLLRSLTAGRCRGRPVSHHVFVNEAPPPRRPGRNQEKSSGAEPVQLLFSEQ